MPNRTDAVAKTGMAMDRAMRMRADGVVKSDGTLSVPSSQASRGIRLDAGKGGSWGG